MTNPTLRLSRRIAAGVSIAVLAALLVACGGDSDNGSAGADPTATQPVATAATGGSASPSNRATPGATVTNQGLANLNSYKYTLKMSGTGGPVGDITSGLSDLAGGTPSANVVMEISGAYIKPDKAQTSIKIAGFETSTVVIGNQQWATFAGQTIGPQPATAADLADANFLEGFWEGEELTQNIKDFNCSGKENVNGVSATKCTADKAVIDRMTQADPSLLANLDATSLSRAQIDIWIADAGYPVRMRMDIAGKDTANKDFPFKVEMDLTDINGNFQITPPRT